MDKGEQNMPIYEYRCNQCGEAFEKMVRFSEADRIPTYPNCESEDTRKAISTIASCGIADSAFSGSAASNCGSGGRFT